MGWFKDVTTKVAQLIAEINKLSVHVQSVDDRTRERIDDFKRILDKYELANSSFEVRIHRDSLGLERRLSKLEATVDAILKQAAFAAQKEAIQEHLRSKEDEVDALQIPERTITIRSDGSNEREPQRED